MSLISAKREAFVAMIEARVLYGFDSPQAIRAREDWLRTAATHYISVNSWAVYVKEADYFKQQGGLTKEWGRTWLPVIATSIEDARKQGEAMLRWFDEEQRAERERHGQPQPTPPQD